MMGEMDHQEVRDLLADAAIEPGGLDRLMAGDTPDAALVASHLAGCPDCADELDRLHRSVGVIRSTVRAVPPPELRDRTLANVATLGRPRDRAAAAPEPAPITPPPAIAAAPTTTGTEIGSGRTRPSARLTVLAGLAAAIVLAVTGTALVVNGSRDAVIRSQSAEIEALGEVALWTLRVQTQPDVERVRLASTTGGQTNGTLVFSPTSKELVVVAENLAPAPPGHEYRCWVEAGGRRASIGKMFFGGDLAYWVGDVAAVAGLGPDARFGVSLVDLAATDQPGQPVLLSAS
jgi:hypothetical protein